MPLVRDLSAEGIPVVVTCEVLGLSPQAFYKWQVLFPRLRPGGLYVIEDWAAHHISAKMSATLHAEDPTKARPRLDRLGDLLLIDHPGRRVPLSRLVTELMLMRATSGELVADLTIGRHWVAVRRGPGSLDPEGFSLSDTYADPYGELRPT